MRQGWRHLLMGTLRRQLVIGVALLNALIMGLFVWDVTTREKNLLLQRRTDQAQALAHGLAASTAGWLATRDLGGLQEIVVGQTHHAELEFAMVLDREGRILAHTDKARLGQYVRELPPQPKDVLAARTAELVDALNPVILGKQHIGWVRVGVGQKAAGQQLKEITRDGWLYALIAIFTGTILTWLAANRLTQRLRAIQTVADAVQARDLGRRVAVNNESDEAATLARAFNTMLDSLAASRAAMQEGERRWIMALDGSGLGVWDWNMQTDKVFYSHQWKDMLGFAEEEISDNLKEWSDRMHPHDMARTQAEIQRHLRGETDIYRSEHRIRCKDGSWKWILDQGMVFGRAVDRTPLRMVGTHTDIGERKALQAEIEANRDRLEDMVAARTAELEASRDRAEKLAQAKSEFLAHMSHEIRTPLNAVLGLTRIVLRENRGRKSEETCLRITLAGEHLLGVINDILDYSKLEEGKLLVDHLPFQLAAVIANAISFVSGAAQGCELLHTTKHADNMPEWVRGDGQRLQQILVNLLSNAVKFSGHGEVRLEVARQGDDTLFKVIDSGIGMDADQMARLFEAFEQGDSSTTRKFGGTGLGLAISQRLAHLMGGNISVDSTPGRGSAFTLRLPLPATGTPVMHVPTEKSAPLTRRLAGLRVLAAEDVEVNRLVLEDILTHEGASVVFGENGQEAVDHLRAAGAAAFDVVLMDVQMPVMDGYQATAEILRITPTLPVIGLTAHALSEERSKSLAAGMADHITKPVDPDELVRAIKRHLNSAPPEPANTAAPPPATLATPPAAPSQQASITAVTPTLTIDWAAMTERFGGRQSFIDKLASTVLNSHDGTPQKLRGDVAAGDLAGIAFTAHSLKGVAGNLAAERLREHSAHTETAARQGDAGATAMALTLAEEVETLLVALKARLDKNVTENQA